MICTPANQSEDIASAFTYDSLGNRVTDQFGNFNYDLKKQRLTEDWKYIYAYDNNGNLSSKILKSDNTKVTGYSHNSENQLVNIKEYDGANVIKETKYFYDVLGRRVKKEHFDNANSINSFARKFQYDGQQILFELDGDNTVLSTFTHSGLRTDDVLAVDKSGTSYFYLKDHLGTVNDIIDGTGSLVQHYVYSPFGKIIAIKDKNGGDVTDVPLVENFYTFTGREFDKESGLYYFRARYLDSETGRFIQSDPHPGVMSSPVSLNSKYIYGNGNPIMMSDPSGRSSAWGWALAISMPGLSFLTMNTTDFFQDHFNFSDKETAKFNTVYITAAIIAASVMTGGAVGGMASTTGGGALGAAFAGGVTGAATGAVVGGTLTTIAGGSFAEGATMGAKLGFLSGAMAGLGAHMQGMSMESKEAFNLTRCSATAGGLGVLASLGGAVFAPFTLGATAIGVGGGAFFYQPIEQHCLSSGFSWY